MNKERIAKILAPLPDNTVVVSLGDGTMFDIEKSARFRLNPKTKRQELMDLDVDRVDGVDRPATGRQFVLFKDAAPYGGPSIYESDPDDMPTRTGPEVVDDTAEEESMAALAAALGRWTSDPANLYSNESPEPMYRPAGFPVEHVPFAGDNKAAPFSKMPRTYDEPIEGEETPVLKPTRVGPNWLIPSDPGIARAAMFRVPGANPPMVGGRNITKSAGTLPSDIQQGSRTATKRGEGLFAGDPPARVRKGRSMWADVFRPGTSEL